MCGFDPKLSRLLGAVGGLDGVVSFGFGLHSNIELSVIPCYSMVCNLLESYLIYVAPCWPSCVTASLFKSRLVDTIVAFPGLAKGSPPWGSGYL